MGNQYKATPTVLLVDDDEDLLHIVDRKLRIEGFQTLLSPNGEKVRDIITHAHPDLVLLDIHMQGVNGGEICKEIKSDPNTSSIPVLLFSANANINTIRAECGADGYITKPMESKVLIDTIRHYLPK